MISSVNILVKAINVYPTVIVTEVFSSQISIIITKPLLKTQFKAQFLHRGQTGGWANPPPHCLRHGDTRVQLQHYHNGFSHTLKWGGRLHAGTVRTLLLLQGQLALVVAEEVAPEQEGELGVVLLLLHGHLFKLWPVSGHKLGQLVDDIPQLLICKEDRGIWARRTERRSTIPFSRGVK